MLKRGAIWLRDFRQTKAFDLLAASPLIVWFLFGLREQAPLTALRLTELLQGTVTLLDFLQLIALIGSFFLTFLLIYLLVIRKTPELRSRGALPRAVAVCGTFIANGFLYLKAVPLSLPAQALADLLIIGSTIGSLVSVSRLGASFSVMPEARALVTTGPYALVRHPLYLAENIGTLGLMLQFQQPWASLLGAAAILVQYWRTIFEESVLLEAYPDYATYRAHTWRFLPYVF